MVVLTVHCTCTYVYLCIYKHAHVHTCMHTYTHTHTHTHTQSCLLYSLLHSLGWKVGCIFLVLAGCRVITLYIAVLVRLSCAYPLRRGAVIGS